MEKEQGKNIAAFKSSDGTKKQWIKEGAYKQS